MRRRTGFTLIELLVTLALIAVSVTLVVPGMRGLITTSRVRSATSDLYSSTVLARSEAIKRNTTVDVVPMSGDWHKGWQVRAGGDVIDEINSTEVGIVIAANSVGNVRFQINGRIASNLHDFTVYAPGKVTARCLRIGASGMPAVRADTDGDPSNGCN
jgi:type IV fimbrial biogenesis protein FimT